MVQEFPGTPDEIVRAELARADRLRRTRASGRRIWAIAPWTAAACALVAALARLAAWPWFVPLSLLGLSLAALASYGFLARRARALTDAATANLDASARSRGELRSAYWFAQHAGASAEAGNAVRDPWIEFHLARAAERVGAIDWPAIFPAAQTGRAKTATALLAVLVIVATLAGPARTPVSASAPADGSRAADPLAAIPLSLLPPALRKQIEAMLAAAEASGGTSLTASEVRDLLAKLDELRAAGRGETPRDGSPPTGPRENTADAKALAERVRRDAENLLLEPEARDALTDLASKLSDEKNAQSSSPKEGREAASANDAQGDQSQSASSGDKQDGSVQSVKESAAAGGVGMVMMNDRDGAQSKEAGLGLGGGSGDVNGGGRMPELAAALRRETVEAQKDTPGENIPTEIRRKTERGDAAVAYTHAQPGAAERGRSTAPPAVPENRRAAVRSYFTRKQ